MEEARQVWERVLDQLQLQVSKANYTTWLLRSHGISYEDSTFVVGVPNTFVAEWLKKRIYALIKKTISELLGRDTNIIFHIDEILPEHKPSLHVGHQYDGGTSVKEKRCQFLPQYTFDKFVVGDCNRLAYAAIKEVSTRPGQSYNPLFLYGPTGQGKTHLLHAIGHQARTSGISIMYTTGERFTSDFVLAVKQKNVNSFQNSFTDVSILLFDDIQFISGKNQTQQSLLHIFDYLYNNNCQFIVTSDCHPDEINSFNVKLKSRLEWGPVFSLQPPDYDTRLSILRAKANDMNLVIKSEVLELIADRVQDNARRLEGSLIYLTAQAKLMNMEISIQSVNNMLTNSNSTRRGTQLVINTVASYFNLLPEDLTSKGRNRKFSLARHLAMYILREDYGYLLSEIGQCLGNRSHATVLHGYKQIARTIDNSTSLRNQTTEIRNRVRRATS